jgi:hypothetical protein
MIDGLELLHVERDLVLMRSIKHGKKGFAATERGFEGR